MDQADVAIIADRLSEGERAALRSLPVKDTGYFDEENWWLYYTLLDAGLLAGSHDMVMRPTVLGEAVLNYLAAASA